MAIISKYQHASFELFVWEITESLDFFVKELAISPKTLEELRNRFNNTEALLQWLASRCALQHLFHRPYEDFKKNAAGKLELIDQSYHLSISHSNHFIAVVKSDVAIGVDIQVPTPKLERIAAKYLAADLLKGLKQNPSYADYLHLYWGIKEALFKAYGLGQVNFINHLHITPFELEEKGKTIAQIIKPHFEATYQVFYEKKEDYYLCIVTNS